MFESGKNNNWGYKYIRIRLDGAYSPVDKYQDIFENGDFFSVKPSGHT